MNGLIQRLRQRFCAHEVFIEDLRRGSDGLTRVPCNRCGKELVGNGGALLGAKLLRGPNFAKAYSSIAKDG